MIRKLIGGVLLIAGTSIGAAVLALPVNTAHMGFQRATLCFIASWIFMTYGALYLLEANLKVGVDVNLISIAKRTAGPLAAGIAWLTYLALLFSLTSAYLTGATNWLKGVLYQHHLSVPFNYQLSGVTIITALLVGMGTRQVDYINRALMIGLIGTYLALAFYAFPYIDLSLFEHSEVVLDTTQLPLIITAFGFAIIIPSLVRYLNGSVLALKKVVIWGSLIPLFIYLLWQALVMGLIPYDNAVYGLKMIQMQDKPAADLSLALQELLNHNWITGATRYFAIFALTTSLLGVTLSLFDFLADGFNLSKKGLNRIGLLCLTFIPPYCIVLYYPIGFSITLKFAGLFVAILLGLLPVWMVWKARYSHALVSEFEVKGGKAMLYLTGLFFIWIIFLEVVNTLNGF
jgi:tyrosine-specific transport protein